MRGRDPFERGVNALVDAITSPRDDCRCRPYYEPPPPTELGLFGWCVICIVGPLLFIGKVIKWLAFAFFGVCIAAAVCIAAYTVIFGPLK